LHLALLYGSTEINVVNDDVLIIHRQYFNQHVWMIINKGTKEALVSLSDLGDNLPADIEEGSAGDIYVILSNQGQMQFGIKANSFGTLISK